MRFFLAVGICVLGVIWAIHDAKHASKACVTDPSQAAVDIILVVDTSAYMGPPRLKQVVALSGSILSKFTISTDKNYTATNPTSRVAIVSYGYNGTHVISNITSLNSFQDVQTSLNSLNASSGNFVADYATAIDVMFLYNAILDPFNVRIPVFLVFSAGITTQNVLDAKYMKYTMITVNYNIANNNVTSFLYQISTPGLSLRSHSKTLENDILNGILSATC